VSGKRGKASNTEQARGGLNGKRKVGRKNQNKKKGVEKGNGARTKGATR